MARQGVRLGFYGAAGEVTGSCYIVSTLKARVMIDMGMHQGEREADDHNRRMPPGNSSRLDAVVLTHAHLDHCGRLPLLVKAGYSGPIHCTQATADVAEVILRDSAEIQVEDCARFNRRLRRGEEPCAEPLYDESHVTRTLPLFRAAPYEHDVRVAPGITARFHEAGHILGSASVRLSIVDGDRRVVLLFSGDIGTAGSPILRDPARHDSADVVVLESTYGDRDHRSLQATCAELLSILQDSLSRGARVLIPAFALGRTQDLVYHMGEFRRAGKLDGLRVFVDSPMAVEVTRLYARHRDLYDERAREIISQNMMPLSYPGLRYMRTVDESKSLNDTTGPMVVIAASGMCTGGRIVHHLYRHLSDPRTHVVIVGFQGHGTLGRRLVDGEKTVQIFREPVAVKAKIHTLGGFSAHAGRSGLLHWAAPLAQGDSKPRVFLTHGENGPRRALRDALRTQFGLEAGMPEYGDEVEI